MANISIVNGAITIKQGTTCIWGYTLKDGLDPIDVTGYSLTCTVRASFDASSPSLVISTANGKVANGGVDGTFTLTLLPADTSGVRFRGESLDAVYDVEITAPDGRIDRIAEGTLTLTREISR